jgi:flagellar hook assembly protein FlgD
VGGREVRTLVTGFAGAGPHTTEWDGRDDRGVALPSGTYFARLVAGGAAVSRTLIRAR